MACTPISQRSLGYVFLDYHTNNHLIPHRARLRLTYPIDPSDLTTIGAEADLWGDAVAAILPSTADVTGWGTMRQDGTVFHIESFPVLKLGTHAAATGARDVRSLTLTFTGKGSPVNPNDCSGPVRHVVFVAIAYWPTPG